LRTIESQLQALTESINTQIQNQLNQLTETVAGHSQSITDTASVLTRMETLLQTLTDKAVTHGQASQSRPPPTMPSHNVKLEFPRFDSSHAMEWLFRANQFIVTTIYL
ncbi:hypothetical protein A2U01_0049997, partial [Trifolium medium]|nr:hypothetical protein [Trifolium medium]